jgi:hypothetical protein
MTGVSHEIGRHWTTGEPRSNDGNHVAHHHDQIEPMGVSQEAEQTTQQIQNLPLDEFGETSLQARVSDPACAEFVAAAQQRNRGLGIRAPQAG